MKKNKLSILILILPVLAACPSKKIDNNNLSDYCTLVYEDVKPKSTKDFDQMNGLTLDQFLEMVENNDTIILRFFSEFNDDSVSVFKNEKFITSKKFKTNKSIAFAGSISLSKSDIDGEFVNIKIKSVTICSLKISKNYRFVDLHYNARLKTFEVHFNNNILFLS